MGLKSLLNEASPQRICWDILQIASGSITAFFLPYCLLSPSTSQQQWDLWITLSVIGLLDAAIQLQTPYEARGEIETSPTKIRQHYYSTWLASDLIGNFATFATPLMPWAGCLQLLRSSQVFRVLSKWENLQTTSPLLLRICRYSFALLMITNWISAAWLWIGLNEKSEASWIARAGLQSHSHAKQYLMSVYWSVTTLASVGYGDITPKTNLEIIAAILVMGAGVLLFAFAIGNVVAFVRQLDNGKSEYRIREAGMRRYLSFNGVTPETLSRLRRFSDYRWGQSQGVDPNQIIRELPASIQSEVLTEILQRSIQHVPLFQHAPVALRNRLLILLRPQIYPPGTSILEADEPGNEIVFITHGLAALETTEAIEDEAIEFRPGEYFGDLSFFLKEVRNSTVVAKTYVEAFILQRDLFDNLMKQDSRLHAVLQAMASGQSSRNQLLLMAGVII
ncbi:MAG: cyclic nucleotide-binding domain-containing protein [Vulcanococcus sp.]